MKIFVILLLSLVIALLSACQIESPDLTSGCTSDEDCRLERVCVDKICVFTEEIREEDKAEDIARKIFSSLIQKEPRIFAVTIPQKDDLNWGFDWISDYNPAISTIDRYDQLLFKLEDDFYDLLLKNDFSDAEFVNFEPGYYVPIPQGYDKAIRNLDSLKNSKIVYSKNNQTYRVNIARLVKLRGRWKVFYLSD